MEESDYEYQVKLEGGKGFDFSRYIIIAFAKMKAELRDRGFKPTGIIDTFCILAKHWDENSKIDIHSTKICAQNTGRSKRIIYLFWVEGLKRIEQL